MKSTTMARFSIVLLLFYILSMVSGCKYNVVDDNSGLKENMKYFKIVDINEELRSVSISEICKNSKDEIAFYDKENAKTVVIN
ncbi:hypothetical protein [Lutispora thermophila]|uniref:Uncharacterized protein n=1 Tax=Lutispora thermophila DSM 19022 TaxID=1122184 RepID=A0A1M6DMJ7_9FIRM|nr:hypothetical protein [Lutispora thermophila]SHI74383.1 hypothetical protein SAMN02745176_01185 [Lutispora thermophila DSM 19022]